MSSRLTRRIFLANSVAIGAGAALTAGSGIALTDDSPWRTTLHKSMLGADDFLKSFAISVETYKGIVQLSGFVDSQSAVNKAGQIAGSVAGVKSVKNNLIVK